MQRLHTLRSNWNTLSTAQGCDEATVFTAVATWAHCSLDGASGTSDECGGVTAITGAAANGTGTGFVANGGSSDGLRRTASQKALAGALGQLLPLVSAGNVSVKVHNLHIFYHSSTHSPGRLRFQLSSLQQNILLGATHSTGCSAICRSRVRIAAACRSASR